MLWKRLWLSCSLTGFFLIAPQNSAVASDFLDSMANPRGVIVVTALYGISSGISNFFWAFNWSKRTGVSDELSASLQEGGGLASSALSIFFGALVPILVYKYIKKHPPRRADADDEDADGDPLDPVAESDRSSSSSDVEDPATPRDVVVDTPEAADEETDDESPAGSDGSESSVV